MSNPKLERVYSASEHAHEIELDVVAIHGLNTDPSRSFQAYEVEGDSTSRLVNWLGDGDMLPAKLGEFPSRIFTYSWNANTFYNASDETFKSQAETLLQKIHEIRAETKTVGLPIIFIASCFGGLLLAKALVLADRSEPASPQQSILKSTNGIAFLGTPFRGSDGVEAAKYRVLVATLLGATTASDLLLRVLENKPGDREELTDAFTTLAMRCQIPVTMFYETEKSDIANALKGLSKSLVAGVAKITGKRTEMVLVPQYSACLDGEWTKVRLAVRHAHMNKFRGPKDPNYTTVSTCIETFLERLLTRHQVKAMTEAKLLAALQKLEVIFPDMSQRYRDIHTAPSDAFRWLSGHRPASETAITAANTFNSWLRSDEESNNVFWIAGKPGAGKSTFMKFLVDSQCIPSVSGAGTLTIFYFFLLVGQPIQRSIEGLLCSLLHQLLAAALEGKQGIHMRNIAAGFTGNDTQDVVQQLDGLRESKLEAILLKLLGILGSSRRIHVCIDGLDEFKSDSGPRSTLPLVSKLRSIPGVKLIVSSRPEDEFRDSFKSKPHLLLQDVTAEEMSSFANERLSVGKIKRDLRISIVGAVVERAEGIFLWAALVTKALLADVEAGKHPETLRESLEEFPQGMSQLYTSIWNRHNKGVRKHQAEAALYFHLLIDSRAIIDAIPGLRFQYWIWQTGNSISAFIERNMRFGRISLHRDDITLFHIAVASDETLARSLLMDGDKVNPDVVLAHCHAVSQALPIRCAGMIDIDIEHRGPAGPDPESSVQFIHRTAHDFFTRTEDGKEILAHATGLEWPEKFRRIVLASLAKNWAFHSVFNQYGVCYPIFASELHTLLTSEGIVKDRHTSGEVDQLVQLCKKLPRGGNVVNQGLQIRCFLGLGSWLLASSHQDQVRLVNACLSWRTHNWQPYHDLITWLWTFIAPWGYTKVPDQLTAFGPRRTSTSQCLVVSVARLAEVDAGSQVTAARALTGRWYQRPPWETLFNKITATLAEDMMYSFSFFGDSSLGNTAFPNDTSNVLVFNKLHPDQYNCCWAKFLILLSFPFDRGLRQLKAAWRFKDRDFRRRDIVQDKWARIMALGYVDRLSKGPQGPSSWRANAVPPKYWDLLIEMTLEDQHQSEHATNVFKQVLGDPESKDLGRMQDYLLKHGITFKDGEDEDAAQVTGEQTRK